MKKAKLLVIATAAALIVAGLGLAVLKPSKMTKSVSPAQPAPVIKQDVTSSGNNTKDSAGNNSSSSQTSTAQNSTQGASIDITSAYQQGSGDLVIQTSIKGAGSGTCQLTLSSGGHTVAKTADVLYQSSFSTCTGFTVSRSELSSGDWQLKLNLLVNNQVVASTTKSATVK
jgi:hypothetical protein